MIACLVIPYFAAAVERGANPALAAAPLIMGAPPQAPKRVLAVSREAAQLGIKPGMSWRQARALYPQGRFIPANPDQYQRIIRDLSSLLASFTPKVEPDGGRLAAIIYSHRTA
jgi:nucleotidyltransferase/DNA polymerase involved in DNA repair